MNAAWAHVTGPFYIPGPDEQPNVFASFMSNFLATKTPWAMKLWEARLQALDPYARYAALAELAKIQQGYDDLAAANWRTQQQTDAMNRGALSDILGVLGRYETARMEANTDAQIANQQGDLKRLEQMTVSSREGLEAVRQARVALNGAVQDFSHQDPAYGDRFALNLRSVQQALAAIPSAAERTAAEQQIARELADGRELFGGSPQGIAAADWIENAARSHFGEPRFQAGVRDVGGAGPLNVQGLYDQANTLLGLPGALPSRLPAPAPAPSSVPSPPVLDPSSPTQRVGSTTGDSGEPAPFSTPSPSGGGVTIRRAGTLPGGGAPDALQRARQELDRDPTQALGGFGQPVPVQEAYLRAYIAAHPELYGGGATRNARDRVPAPAAAAAIHSEQSTRIARQVPAPAPPRAMGYPGTAERMQPDPARAISFADTTHQIRQEPLRAAAVSPPRPQPVENYGPPDLRSDQEQQARTVLARLREAVSAGRLDEADELQKQLDALLVH